MCTGCVDWLFVYILAKLLLNIVYRQAFDDATKSIRNDTNSLMRKIHQRVERAQSCLPASSYTAKWVVFHFFFVLLICFSLKSKTKSLIHVLHYVIIKVWKALWSRFICGSSRGTAQEHHLQRCRIVESTQVHRYVI